LKNYAELASRLRTAALATQTFPTERGRRLRAEHEQMLNDAAEALENVGTELAKYRALAEDSAREAAALRDQIGRLVPDRK
jgi:hypothetical protein